MQDYPNNESAISGAPDDGASGAPSPCVASINRRYEFPSTDELVERMNRGRTNEVLLSALSDVRALTTRLRYHGFSRAFSHKVEPRDMEANRAAMYFIRRILSQIERAIEREEEAQAARRRTQQPTPEGQTNPQTT